MLMQLASRNSSFCTWSVHAVYSAHNACVSVGCSSAAGSTRYSCSQLLCLVNRRSRTWSSTAWFWRGNSHTHSLRASARACQAPSSGRITVLVQHVLMTHWPGNMCMCVLCAAMDRKWASVRRITPTPAWLCRTTAPTRSGERNTLMIRTQTWVTSRIIMLLVLLPSQYLLILICEPF